MTAAPVPLARFQRIPSVNTTANGGAIRNKIVCTFSKSVSEDFVKPMAIHTLASKITAPLQRPIRTCWASLASRLINFL